MVTDNSLDELRRKIDSCDKEIIALLKKRMDIVIQVAEIKKKKRLPIKDASRESAILLRIKDLEDTQTVQDLILDIYKCIIDKSCDLQRQIIG